MKLLDLTNPRHQQIVAEEIARAKRIQLAEQSDSSEMPYGEELATSTQIGRMNLRAIKSKLDMTTLNPYPDNPYNKLVIKYLDIVNVDTLDEITTEQSTDLLVKLHELASKLKPSDIKWGHTENPNVNPYDQAGGRPSTGYLGSKWTGD
jgi:hypothetical protein